MSRYNPFIFSFFFLILSFQGLSQTDSTRWEYIESVVQYDADTRFAILQASTQPEVLNQISDLQKKAQKQFQGIIKSLDRPDQEAIYKLVSCEGLLDASLQLGSSTNGDQVEALLAKTEFSTELTSKELYQLLTKRSKSLERIQELLEEAKEEFNEIIENKSNEVQSAYRQLIRMPDVLDILASNVELTKEMGVLYSESPEYVTAKADSLAIFYQAEQEKEVAEYQKELNEDSELQEQMEMAAAEFAKEEGYSEEDLAEAKSASASSTNAQANVNYAPYPYWVGYPYWYPAPYWRPYPWYYHCGFYYGGGGGMVVFGMPTYHYTSWYYRSAYVRYPASTRYHAYHHNRYPYSRNGFNNSIRRNNVVIKNNTINVGGKNTGISTGNRYDFNRGSAQSKPNIPKAKNRGGKSLPAKNQGQAASRPVSSKAKDAKGLDAKGLDQKVKSKSNGNQSKQNHSKPSQSFRTNENHRNNWKSSPSSAPMQRPAGGGGRRRGR